MSGGGMIPSARPTAPQPMTGGLQQMQMLNQYRQGTPMNMLQNPTSQYGRSPFGSFGGMQRPMGYLPPALPTFDYAAQARQQAAAQAAAAPQPMTSATYLANLAQSNGGN